MYQRVKSIDKVGDPPRTKGEFTFEELQPRAVVVRQRWPWVELIDPLSERTFYKNVLLVKALTFVGILLHHVFLFASAYACLSTTVDLSVGGA